MDYRFEYLVDLIDGIHAGLERRNVLPIGPLDAAPMLSAITASIENLNKAPASAPELYLRKLVLSDLLKEIGELIDRYVYTITFEYSGEALAEKDSLEKVCRNHVQFMLHDALYRNHWLAGEDAPSVIRIIVRSQDNVLVEFIDKYGKIPVATEMKLMNNMWICLDDLKKVFCDAIYGEHVVWSPMMPEKNIKYQEDEK